MAVHTSLRSLADALERYPKEIDRNSREYFIDAVKAAATTMWVVTPVATGFLRSNWALVPAGGRPPVGRFGSYAELFAARSGSGSEGRGIADIVGIQMVDDISEDAEKLRIGDVIDIANGTHYAILIEAGHSRKAPAGMLGPAVQVLEAHLARGPRLLRRAR